MINSSAYYSFLFTHLAGISSFYGVVTRKLDYDWVAPGHSLHFTRRSDLFGVTDHPNAVGIDVHIWIAYVANQEREETNNVISEYEIGLHRHCLFIARQLSKIYGDYVA